MNWADVLLQALGSECGRLYTPIGPWHLRPIFSKPGYPSLGPRQVCPEKIGSIQRLQPYFAIGSFLARPGSSFNEAQIEEINIDTWYPLDPILFNFG